MRALSDGNANASSSAPAAAQSAPKFKLADYRYGREEMLALFNPHNLKPPEKLKEEFPHLFVEKYQVPLALTNMSEDESRLWTRVNSDVVLRLVNKGNNDRGERSGNERGGIAMRAGRGGLSDRGRGRGRGFYQRNSYEEGGDSPPERRDFRNRTFERNNLNDENSRDRKFDRSFSRGGGGGGGGSSSSGGGGGNGSVEDRDSMLRKNASRSSSVENWRTGGRGEDREGWRTARGPTDNWQRDRNNSWRAGDRDFDEMEHSERNGPHRKYSNYKDRNPNDLWDDSEDFERRNNLPEWSLDDDPDTKLGTFDSSGAFREDSNEEDEQENENKLGDDYARDQTELAKDDTKIGSNSKISNQTSKSNMNNSQHESKVDKQRDKSDLSAKIDDLFPSKGSTVPQTQTKGQNIAKSSDSSKPPSNKLPKSSNSHFSKPLEEDGFAHLEKEAENMVAQWTADDDQKDRPTEPTERHTHQHSIEDPMANNIPVLPMTHEDALKWFYRDPQNEIQGPFTPHEMYDWFTAGYFAMDLLVRRGCDEYFTQLGELFKIWERIPFIHVQNSTPPPLRLQSSNSHQSLPINSSASHPPVHNMGAPAPQHLIHPHMASQTAQPPQPPHLSQQAQPMAAPTHQNYYLTSQQSADMQSQLRLLLAQLKKQEGFSELTQQQQQEVLVQRYVHLEQQRQQALQTSIPNKRSAEDSQLNPLEALSNLRIQGPRPPVQVVGKQGQVPSIWDITGNSAPLSVRDIEEMQRKEQELKELEERRKAFEEEQARKKLEHEELQRKLAEDRERKFEELQKKLEEERHRNQELLRKQEEEKRRREEEERLRVEEEERRANEKAAEEQRRRQEELLRLEEYARLQALQDEERRRQIEAEKERQRLQLKEIERERQKEMERIQRIQQQEAMIQHKLQQQQMERQRKAGPVWGQSDSSKNQTNSLTLDDIQRLQEEKDREERQKQLQQQHMQALLAAQQQQQKQSLSWAAPTYQQSAPVKTLAEIQREEAEKVAKQRVIENKKQHNQLSNSVPNAGIWNNATNQLFTNKPVAPTKVANTQVNNSSPSIGFWEPESRKVQTNRANESALHSMQTNPKGNNSTQVHTKSISRNKKEEVFH